jgi:hypothetical protein
MIKVKVGNSIFKFENAEWAVKEKLLIIKQEELITATFNKWDYILNISENKEVK